MAKINVVLSGVGGQGVITAANILGKAAVNAEVNVYASEVHGMAQRGGSVFCTVRMEDVSGPLVSCGTADAIISMEPVEALRYIRFAHSKTKVVTDITPISTFEEGFTKISLREASLDHFIPGHPFLPTLKEVRILPFGSIIESIEYNQINTKTENIATPSKISLLGKVSPPIRMIR